MDSKSGMLTRSGRRLSIDKLDIKDEDGQSTCSTPTKRRGRRLSTKPELEDLPETEILHNEKCSTEKVEDGIETDIAKKELLHHVVTDANMDSPSRSLRNRNIPLASPMGAKLKESNTPKKAVRKLESSLMPNIVDSPKLRKNKKLENVDIDVSMRRRSRRLSGELNVVIEDPVREQEGLKMAKKGKRLSMAPVQPPLPEESEDITESEAVNKSMDDVINTSEVVLTNKDDSANLSNTSTKLVCSPVSVVVQKMDISQVNETISPQRNIHNSSKSDTNENFEAVNESSNGKFDTSELNSSSSKRLSLSKTEESNVLLSISSPASNHNKSINNHSTSSLKSPSPRKSARFSAKFDNKTIEEVVPQSQSPSNGHNTSVHKEDDEIHKNVSLHESFDKEIEEPNSNKSTDEVTRDDQLLLDIKQDEDINSSCDVIPESQDVNTTPVIKSNKLNNSLKAIHIKETISSPVVSTCNQQLAENSEGNKSGMLTDELNQIDDQTESKSTNNDAMEISVNDGIQQAYSESEKPHDTEESKVEITEINKSRDDVEDTPESPNIKKNSSVLSMSIDYENTSKLNDSIDKTNVEKSANISGTIESQTVNMAQESCEDGSESSFKDKVSAETENDEEVLEDKEDSSVEEGEDFIKLQLIDESASEAESDYKSGDSLGESEREEMDLNEIVEAGESLRSDSNAEDSDLSSYEKDSFVCSDDEHMDSEEEEMVETIGSEPQAGTDTNENNISDAKITDKKMEGTWIVSPWKPLSESNGNQLQSSKRRKLCTSSTGDDGQVLDSGWTGTAGAFDIVDEESTERPTCPISASDYGSTASFKVVSLKNKPKHVLKCDPMSNTANSFKENMLYGKHIKRKDFKTMNNINQKVKASNLHKHL